MEDWSRVIKGYLPIAETLSVLVISWDGLAASCNLKTIKPITTLASVDLNEIVISWLFFAPMTPTNSQTNKMINNKVQFKA